MTRLAALSFLLLLLARDDQGLGGARAADRPLEELVRALDAAREPAWTAALDGLSARGVEAAERVLADFESADFAARRARAKLLVQIPASVDCARVLELSDDPDPQVRRLLAMVLGSPALAETAAAERVERLEELALRDPSDNVRLEAREGLAECGLASAVPALDRLIDALPTHEGEKAAAALARLPLARERLVARVTGTAGARAPSSAGGPIAAALLSGYGRALAEVPRGGEDARELRPLLQARVDPDPDVRAAARVALATFVARAAELSEAERADRVLSALAAEGWPRTECLRRRIDLAWVQRGDPGAALALARELVRAAQGLADPAEAEAWEVHARFLEGAALAALGNHAGAAALFDAIGARLSAGLVERPDLFPTPLDTAWTKGGGAARVDQLHLLALVRTWRALLHAETGSGADAVLAELRAAHAHFLESRAAAIRTGASDPGTLDALFDRDLSPYTLVLFNEKLAPERRAHALDRALELGRAWGAVAPLEMQGFAPSAPGGESTAAPDLFADPERLARLLSMRAAEKVDLERELRDLRDGKALVRDSDARVTRERLLTYRIIELQRAESEERAAVEAARRDGRALGAAELRTVYAQLLEYLAPSSHARTLASELLAEGRSREARELCERALEVLRVAPLGSPIWAELSSARLEMMRGSAFMDEDRPQEAERAFEQGEKRLASIGQKLTELRDASGDPEMVRAYDAQLATVRTMRGDALLSMAVNANVRMKDPARALGFFERAYDLNQSPFMRVLRACYRARSGKAEEARTVLRTVVPVPSLYYNIGCTHALLGDKDMALDFLERDLAENHPTEGSRAQKRDWARSDPDLASLRDEPRFTRLFGER